MYDTKKVEKIREMYPENTRIEMDFMDDPRPILPGTKGTVKFVDDAGQVQVRWDNGRLLAVIPDTDKFHKI